MLLLSLQGSRRCPLSQLPASPSLRTKVSKGTDEPRALQDRPTSIAMSFYLAGFVAF